MNTPIIRWLLDLDEIPTDAENVRLAWENPWPPWLWALLVLAAAALAVWSYSRLSGRGSTRAGLALVRALLVLGVLVLLAGPMLELPREAVEADWVVVMADRSQSLTVADAETDGRRIAREQQLGRIVDDTAPVWQKLREQRKVQWMGFHAGAFVLPVAADGRPELGEPVGTRTNLDAALEQVLQRVAARRVSGVVLFSDGRTVEPPSRAVVRRFQSEDIRVYAVGLGSPDPLGDLALRRVDAPRRAFVRDKVPVVVELDRLGAPGDLAGEIRLVDETTGEVLDAVTLAGDDERDQVTLTAEPKLTGEATWRVEIETERPDLVPDNNIKPFLIELIDRPLRVLYVEGYPRWEYRYLKNLLIREASIESSVMLLSADRDFAQEGNEPITRLPRSPEEFARYDVIVLGDAPASFFTPDQLEIMRNHVAERGAGLLWIGGQRNTPSSYAGTVLTDLLPMRGSLELSHITAAVNMQPTPLAERLGLLQLVTLDEVGWPEALVDPSYGWSQLYGVQRVEPGQLKPTTEVLATTTVPVDDTALPLVMNIRYGAGQCIYVATDEIWRWRYGQGELLPDQFWIQMIRMLGRESLSVDDAGAVLDVNPRRVEMSQPMRIDLRLLDAELIDGRPASVSAILETAAGETVRELELRPVPGSESAFAATYLPEQTGELQVRISDPMFAGLSLFAPVEVFAPDSELRRPETDHALLAHLASQTGGRMLAEDELEQLLDPALLPNRAVRTENPLRERIWDTPLAFGLMLLLLTLEWIGRKIVRLV